MGAAPYPRYFRRNPRTVLAISFVSGLAAGTAASASAGDPLMRTVSEALSVPGSLSGILTAALMPFVLSALAVAMGRPVFLYPIAFGKAFLTGFLGFAVLGAYGSAGWLVRGLSMFTECLTLPVLLIYWFRHLSPEHPSVPLSTAAAVFAAVLAGAIDYCIVSPFLAAVIS